MKLSRKQSLHRRHRRVRKDVNGSTARPRLAVFRSSQHIYAQIIDDTEQHTIAAASTLEPELKAKIKTGGNIAAAVEVGKLVAERAKAKGIDTVVFDRGGNLYHGRVQALADAAREAGLTF
jgi:large subunit ribosomal protein L18